MIRFNNDYNHTAHPAVLDAIKGAGGQDFPGYGLDDACERAAALIRELADAPHAHVHFLLGGTQANYTLIAHALRPWESVISAAGAHINDHETGAVEHTGHKIEACASEDGKVTAEGAREIAQRFRESDVKEHITRPRLVFASAPSEVGTIYSKRELEELRDVCDEYGMYLFVDGARMAYGLGSPEADVTLADFAQLADVFWIGGTKCGALFGEAMVIVDPSLEEGFRASMKQGGGLLAKGFLLGLQFEALLSDGLYFELGREACRKALVIREAFERAGVPLYVNSPTNQQFAVLNDAQVRALAQQFHFEFEGRLADGRAIARFCTSWSTTDEDVAALTRAIAALS